MKSIKFILAISFIAAIAIPSAHACWDPIYPLNTYFMFRGYDFDAEDSDSDSSKLELSEYEKERLNCELWQQLTSSQIPFDDIKHIVYTMTLPEYEEFYSNPNYLGRNKFAIWIKESNDTEILDFLLLAKNVEFIRLEQNSRWYYPSVKNGVSSSLDEIVNKALANKSPRLRDRYLLQAIRALMSLNRYEECLTLWKDEISKLPNDNLMRRMVYEYVLGADIRTVFSKEAFEYCLKSGHIEYLRLATKNPQKNSYTDIFELAYQHSPNSKRVEKLLHDFVRRAEPDFFDQKHRLTDDHRKTKSLALRIGADPKINNRALWYYAAAFIANLEEHFDEASRILTLAENAPGTQFVKESIKILRMHIDARSLTCNDAYERRLFTQLSWLDNKIRQDRKNDYYSNVPRYYNYSYYYWNDMLRRILLDDVCPRMIAAGRTTRALQLANMAENRLIQLSKTIEVWSEDNMSIEAYRRSPNHRNEIDYRNYFFAMADSIGTDKFIEYHNRVRHPQSAFDRFLNDRGYTDSDYLNDISGTLCLRDMRYEEAERYLRDIKPSFANHLNTIQIYDPFNVKSRQKITGNFKHRFAKEMVKLHNTISTTTDPNIKAKAMYSYANGLRNSFSLCWELTQYYQGGNDTSDTLPRDRRYSPSSLAAIEQANNMLDSAIDIATDDELKAQLLFNNLNYITVVKKYPHTHVARMMRGHCDSYRDYQWAYSASDL